MRFLAILLLFIQAGYAQSVIQVVAGQQKTVTVGRPVDILVGNSGIAMFDYRSGTTGTLVGRNPGFTSLTLKYSGGREETRTVHVLARDPKMVTGHLQDILGGIKGLKYRIAGDIPVVEGEISDPGDLQLFEKVMERYPDILNMVKVTVPGRMVGVSVRVVEMNLSKGHDYKPWGTDNLGFSGTWTENNGATGRMLAMDLTASLFPKIEYWISSGVAQLLADPVISGLDGKPSHFQIGGEIPYEYNTQDGKTVEWKEYGVILDVTPRVQASGEVILELEGEVSSIDETRQTSQNVPGLITRRIKNTVAVRSGETVIISGIKYKESTTYKKRVPVLGHLLPFLFYQRATRTEDKELLIMVTPTAPAKIALDGYERLRSVPGR